MSGPIRPIFVTIENLETSMWKYQKTVAYIQQSSML